MSTAATNVHASGFGSAYIRELLVYKAQGGSSAKATTTKKKKKR